MKSQRASIKKIKEIGLMTWTTPEEIERIRKRKKTLLVISLPVVTIVLSAALTLLLN
ncbi:hypothetical protein [Metabacillus sp. FJAT-53654]|uniref:Uncharacterized protein n=1 Tax=Metabacillus rhizosphaerae TaxID=3117747 RepID=A0ABZ2MWX0_9BACI